MGGWGREIIAFVSIDGEVFRQSFARQFPRWQKTELSEDLVTKLRLPSAVHDALPAQAM